MTASFLTSTVPFFVYPGGQKWAKERECSGSSYGQGTRSLSFSQVSGHHRTCRTCFNLPTNNRKLICPQLGGREFTNHDHVQRFHGRIGTCVYTCMYKTLQLQGPAGSLEGLSLPVNCELNILLCAPQQQIYCMWLVDRSQIAAMPPEQHVLVHASYKAAEILGKCRDQARTDARSRY